MKKLSYLYFKVGLNKRNRVFLYSYVFFIFFLSSIIVYDAYKTHQNEIKQFQVSSTNLSLALEFELTSSFNSINLILIHLQKDFEVYNEIKRKHSDDINNILSEIKILSDKILSLKVFDLEGKFIGDDRKIISSDNVKERIYFKKFLENPKNNVLIMSEPVISKTMGVWVMTLNRPIYNKKKQPIGLICITISLEKLKDSFSRLELGKGTVVLYDWNGIFYTSFPFNKSKVGKTIKKRTHNNLYKTLNQSVVYLDELSPVENRQRLYTFRKFTQNSTYPFSIGIGYDKKEILNEWLKRSIFQFGILIILSIGIWIFLVRYLISQERLKDQKRQNLQNSKLSSLGEMASGIAHEINNPLMVILGTANSVQKLRERGEFKEDKVDLYMKKIIENTYRITKIISGLKNFTRDSFEDDFKPTMLEKLYNNTKDLCHSRIVDRNINLQFESSGNIELNCREVQLVQVFVNLVNNSIDALGDNPEKEKWIKIVTEVKDQTVFIKFIDNGTGITQEIAEKIMNPFFTTKEVGKGTGLGLSISKGIIEDHGGKFYLDLDSEFTTFVIELPKK